MIRRLGEMITDAHVVHQCADDAADAGRDNRHPPPRVAGAEHLGDDGRFRFRPNRASHRNGAAGKVGTSALDAITAVEGVTGVFIGPSDLAADMGHLGNPTAPEVQEAVIGALARIRALGKAAGVLTSDNEFARKCLEAGGTFVAVGSDVGLYVSALTTTAARFTGRRTEAKGY